jgi:hypothetical protein
MHHVLVVLVLDSANTSDHHGGGPGTPVTTRGSFRASAMIAVPAARARYSGSRTTSASASDSDSDSDSDTVRVSTA